MNRKLAKPGSDLITVMKRALSSTKNYKIGLSELF